MKHLLVFASVPLLLTPIVCAQVESVPHAPATAAEPANRELVLPDIPGLTPKAHLALMEILAVEAKILELTLPIDAAGQPITDKEVYAAKLNDPDGPFQAYMQFQRMRFDLHGGPPPPDRFVADLIRFDAGYQAAKALITPDEPWDANELLGLLSTDYFLADPLWNTPDALEYQASGARVGGLAPLTNEGALGFLFWGVLRQDEYWIKAQERPGDNKESLIATLLVRGVESPLLGDIVMRALEFPMLPPDEEHQATCTGLGIAGPLEDLRDKVGFTETHEELLAADLDLIPLFAALSKTDELSETVESGQAIEAEAAIASHLKFWLPEMLARVRQELYPLGASEKMRHSPSQAEREAYWRRVFATYGFVVGREMVLEELGLIMDSQDQHQNTPRINELLLLREAGLLTEEQAEELQTKLIERDNDRNELIKVCMGVMAGSGVMEHHELLLQTLTQDVQEIIGGITPPVLENLMKPAWMRIGLARQPLNLVAVRDEFMGARSDLPYDAFVTLLNGAAIHDFPGARELHREIVTTGTPRQVAAAMTHIDWMPKEEFAQVAHRSLEMFDAKETNWRDRIHLVASIISAVAHREDRDEARAHFMELVESKRFVADGPQSFVSAISYKAEDYIRALLSPEEIAQLQAAGKLDLDL